MNAKIQQRLGDVIAALDRGTEPHAVQVAGVLSVELMETDAALPRPLKEHCPDGRAARCELVRDSRGRLICVWHC
jgi:hypothetical protein